MNHQVKCRPKAALFLKNHVKAIFSYLLITYTAYPSSFGRNKETCGTNVTSKSPAIIVR